MRPTTFFTISFISVLPFISNAVSARTNCPPAPVSHIQIEGTKVLYQQTGSPWRTLGFLNQNNGTEQRLAALITAHTTGSQ